MKTTAYEALLEEQRLTPGDIARNLESLSELARVEASAGEPAAGTVGSEMTEAAATTVAPTEDC